MTSQLLDKAIIHDVKTFATNSMTVLKYLVGEEDSDASIESDARFISKALELLSNQNSIWKKQNGIYLRLDDESISARAQIIRDIAIKINKAEEDVQAIITRIFNALRRAEYRGISLDEIFEGLYDQSFDELLQEEA